MDRLTFVDHLIGHLAWPLVVTVLVVFLSMRHRVAMDTLLHRVRKAKAGPFEAELDKLEAAADAASLPPVPQLPPSRAEESELPAPGNDSPEAWLSTFRATAERDPRNAVLMSYQYLCGFLVGASKRLDPEQTRYTDGSPAVMRTAAAFLFAPQHADVLDRLREAALSALEDEAPSSRQAREYVELVARLMIAVRDGIRRRAAER